MSLEKPGCRDGCIRNGDTSRHQLRPGSSLSLGQTTQLQLESDEQTEAVKTRCSQLGSPAWPHRAVEAGGPCDVTEGCDPPHGQGRVQPVQVPNEAAPAPWWASAPGLTPTRGTGAGQTQLNAVRCIWVRLGSPAHPRLSPFGGSWASCLHVPLNSFFLWLL